MIPRANIIEWREHAPWRNDAQVEQDLILSRIIIELFSEPFLAANLLFRGGTAIHKLFLAPAVRYSEDIDLVQKSAVPIGEVMGRIRELFNPLLGTPRTKQKQGSVVFAYKTESELPPVVPMRIKIEINTREHFNVFDTLSMSYKIESRWFSGESPVQTYRLEELLGTKLRALYQRKKGRDLFDLWYGIEHGNVDLEKIIHSFRKYMQYMNLTVSRREFQQNLQLKIMDPNFTGDIAPIIRDGTSFTLEEAYDKVVSNLLERL